MYGFDLRPAGAADLPFLREMLYEAATWATRRGRPNLEETLAKPAVARYLDGWPRDGEAGLVAETWDGVAVGAAWWRRFTAADPDPGYGFVAPEIPELTLAVAPGWRRRGIGAALLAGLMQAAAADGIPALPERRGPERRAAPLREGRLRDPRPQRQGLDDGADARLSATPARCPPTSAARCCEVGTDASHLVR